MMYVTQPKELGIFCLQERYRGHTSCPLQEGLVICGERLQRKTLQPPIDRIFPMPLKKKWAAQDVLSSWSMEVGKHSLTDPLGWGLFVKIQGASTVLST